MGVLALVAAFAVDFYFDVRGRDFFSWMDPYQYYEFALGVVQGRERFDGFEIPSIFPFFVMPILAWTPSIPSALWINFVAMLVLLVGLRQIGRELGVRTPTAVVGLLVLSSPILVGLARTMYVEFTLTALASIVFWLWLRFLRLGSWAAGVEFGLALALAYLTKTTFPLFMVAPIGAAVAARAVERRDREAAALAGAGLLPIVLAVLLHMTVFSQSAGYYSNLVATERPFMVLMGPRLPLSLASIVYYPGEVARSLLFLLTPLLFAPLVAAWRSGRPAWADLASPRAGLWLWFLAPLVLLTFHPLKEPRHAAVCVVPAVLLIVTGIEALPRRPARRALLAVAVALALLQLAAVTRGAVEKPYFVDRALRQDEILGRMLDSDPSRLYSRTPVALRTLHWKYNQNVAVAGFPPNEALALTWHGFPGVVFDLDGFDESRPLEDGIAYQSFEDLFFLAGVNAYNRRCGWMWYQETLSRETVVEHADFLILNDVAASVARERFPGFELLDPVEREGGRILVLRSARTTVPYRALYARAFLERNDALPEPERRAVAEELLLTAVLAGDGARARAVLEEFPVLSPASPPARNIYWIGGYPALLRLASRMLAAGAEE